MSKVNKVDYDKLLQSIKDNIQAADNSFNERNYLFTFLLNYSLCESVLRIALNCHKKSASFKELIELYEKYLKDRNYPYNTFNRELRAMNSRRNRIVHDLWKYGYSKINKNSKGSAQMSSIVFSLLLEWFETFYH